MSINPSLIRTSRSFPAYPALGKPITTSGNETIVLPKIPIENDPALKIQLKENLSLEKQTIVHCNYKSHPYLQESIRIWSSTYLKPKGSTEVYRLLNAFNITFYPDWTSIRTNANHHFTLIFEGLPNDCNVFDLFEEIPEPGGFFSSNIQRNESDIYHLKL
jgi:hypothetical protein